VVADALSRKAHCHCLSIAIFNDTLCNQMRKLNLEIIPQGSLNLLSIESTLQDRIIMLQLHDEGIKIIKSKLSQGEAKYKGVFGLLTKTPHLRLACCHRCGTPKLPKLKYVFGLLLRLTLGIW
jgi:hypothetical protein